MMFSAYLYDKQYIRIPEYILEYIQEYEYENPYRF